MRKSFDNFTIEYTEMDLVYIDDLIYKLLISHEEIMNFFHLKKLDKKVYIKIWSNYKNYKTFVENEVQRLFHKSITLSDWNIGNAIATETEKQIHLLTYTEILKRKSHYNYSIENMLTLCLHEFVHICHNQFKHQQTTLTWFNEALATVLSKQYPKDFLNLNCTLEEFLNGHVDYVKYYTLGRYLFENYKSEDILKLAKNNQLLQEKTPFLFQEAKQWLETITKQRKIDEKNLNKI